MRPYLLRIPALLLLTAFLSGVGGCTAVDEWQRRLAYRPLQEISATPREKTLEYNSQWIQTPVTENVAAGMLHGWWVPQVSPDAPAVLYLHGNAGNISSGRNLEIVNRLHQAGFSVLTVDYRGFGQSSPALPDESACYADARAAWERMVQLSPQAKKHLVYGHSLGGAVAIDLALTAPRLDALVVESTYTSFGAVIENTPYRWLPRALLTQKYPSDEKIARIHVPKLFIHGAMDTLIPIEMGKQLYNIASEPKSFLTVPDGRHRDAAIKAGEEWTRSIRRLAELEV